MVRVKVRWERGQITRLEVTGHAGFAPRGEDIVCAAVSTLAQTAVVGLREVAGVVPEVTVREGNLSCEIPRLAGDALEKSQVIMKTVLLGFKGIEKAHPEYVEVLEQEAV